MYEASGCAGKLAIFAVRLDTFASAKKTETFYIGTKSPQLLTQLRRDILQDFQQLPILAEYVHATAFDIATSTAKTVS